MRQLLTALAYYQNLFNAAIASSTLFTTINKPPRHSSKNFCSAGVNVLAEGGFFPSFTSIRTVCPLNPTIRSGNPPPCVTTRTVAPIARSASTISFWLSSTRAARRIGDNCNRQVLTDAICVLYSVPHHLIGAA